MNAFARALQSGKFCVVKACEDCHLAYHGYNPLESNEDWRQEVYAETVATYDVSEGHPHNTEWSDDYCGHAEEECPDDADCDCGYDSYSTTACGMCGSPLHGTRYDMTLIHRDELKG